MRYLLDTHALIWWMARDRRISPAAIEAIGGNDHVIYVSAVSAWEIAIKKALGKLSTPNDLEEQMRRNAIRELPISIEHATAAGQLPLYHRDPFDRMLVAQAMLEDLTLITRDKNIAQYAVNLLLA